MPAFRTNSRRGFLSRLFARPARGSTSHLLSATAFEAAFKRERALATRTRRQFALIVLVPRNPDDEEPDFLATAIVNRLRASDLAGRLGHDRVALLLPETDESGAHAVVDSILTTLADANLQYDYDLFSYPSCNGTHNGHGQRRYAADEHVEGAGGRTGDLDSIDRDSLVETVAANGNTNGNGQPRLTIPGPGAIPGGGDTIEVEGSALRVQPLAVNGSNSRPRELELSEIRELVGRAPAQSLDAFLLQPVTPARRLFDIVASGTLLLLLSPLLAAIAVLVKITSPGPVFFCQKRAGLGGEPFCFYKFRSMYIDAEDRKDELRADNEKEGPIFKIRNDPRITPIGRLIRKASIDELPQLYNVLRGDMTLIGPRPATLDEVEQYEPWQRERLHLQGGLTCIWQVSGRSEVEFDDWMRMDLQYARKKSVLMDASLLLRTVGAVVTGRGAY